MNAAAHARWKEAHVLLTSLRSTVLDAATMAATWLSPDRAVRSIRILQAYVQSVEASVCDGPARPLDLTGLEEGDVARILRTTPERQPLAIECLVRGVFAAEVLANSGINSGLDGKVAALVQIREKLAYLQDLKTVKPLSYSIHLKSLLLIFLWTLPPVLLEIFHFIGEQKGLPLGVTVCLVEAVIAFAFTGIDAAAQEAEAPMGDDASDIDVAEIIEKLRRDAEYVISDIEARRR
jgi:predicted membrane chloride channel (bestrophin family)